MVLTPIGCGSGGGAPVGRRCRAARGTAAAVGGPSVPGGAAVCSVFSLTVFSASPHPIMRPPPPTG